MASSSPQLKIHPLSRALYTSPFNYTSADFRRQDESPDTQWYSQPRFVQHIDDGAIEVLKSYYGRVIKPKSSILDLCSSWVSHLPASLQPQTMMGYGMNDQEMQRNKHLTSHFAKNLNVSPSLKEVEDKNVDVVICNVSVDYIVKPIDIFIEMRRVLKVGGTAHMAFSNRCFPTEVIGKWSGMNDEERRKWVGGYFWASGGWKDVEELILKKGTPGFMGFGGEDPMYVVRGTKA